MIQNNELMIIENISDSFVCENLCKTMEECQSYYWIYRKRQCHIQDGPVNPLNAIRTSDPRDICGFFIKKNLSKLGFFGRLNLFLRAL